MISAADIKDQELTIIVSMMLIELALLCLTRAAFFKRLALLDTPGRHSAYTPFLAQMKTFLASAGLRSRALAYLQLVSRTCR
jgi:hypothetical protein